ncbi:S1 family peptidase [Qipengyuania marisflavi]|uniref:Trypsin-like peptidase domain-containing protein n=1 Tax=Qipengyuania marisflavi TaxID=2486356 RepID=A0A5S3P9Z5_9SPHN|nr:serine protease [Qipengyuania marisflavi]TMM50352.1 trypsin-like peptidase domain-containing protein [Qipengyuania marisflavi]
MTRLLMLCAAMLTVLLPVQAAADPADINAAARGVVRVVIIASEDGTLVPVSHGTGFAVTRDTVVTNAHVVLDAVQDRELRIGIVSSGGQESVYGRILAVSPKNDLALIRITGKLRLPPLALAGGVPPESGAVTSVGYPMNVDRAQGLDLSDIFRSQPPVKSRGFVSGTRPSRQFDTILHTAPIARGNSGGPLLDDCGRVVGVNSFGADNEGGDAEFFFAVSNRELAPFLRANAIEPQINEQACRSLADLDDAERARIEREQAAVRQDLADRSALTRAKRERAQLEAEQSVVLEREDRMALAFVLLLIAFGLGQWALSLHRGAAEHRKKAQLIAGAAAVCVLAALAAYLTRRGLDEIDRRVAAAMQEHPATGTGAATGQSADAALTCTLAPERSRVTSAQTQDISFDWTAGGCVNERTQYGFASGTWSRVLVPNDEDAVSVNSFDPDRRIFRTERYLLPRAAMEQARAARAKYQAPKCGSADASAKLGELQSEVLSQLKQTPNERLVFECGGSD